MHEILLQVSCDMQTFQVQATWSEKFQHWHQIFCQLVNTVAQEVREAFSSKLQLTMDCIQNYQLVPVLTGTDRTKEAVEFAMTSEVAGSFHGAVSQVRSSFREAGACLDWVSDHVIVLAEAYDRMVAADLQEVLSVTKVQVAEMNGNRGASVAKALGNCTSVQVLYLTEQEGRKTIACRLAATLKRDAAKPAFLLSNEL